MHQQKPLWNAVADAWFGGDVKRPHRTRVGKIVRDLEDLGATPNELRRRITNYKHLMPKCICSPEAIVKWWPTLDGGHVAGVASRSSASRAEGMHDLRHEETPIPTAKEKRELMRQRNADEPRNIFSLLKDIA